MKLCIVLGLACVIMSGTNAEERTHSMLPGANIRFIKLNSSNTRSDSGIEYYMSPFKSTYNNAFNYCTQSGRKLAMIKTEVEEEDVVNGLIDMSHIVKGNVWLNSYCLNGVWYWGDQSFVKYNKLPSERTDCHSSNEGIMIYGPDAPQDKMFTWAGLDKSEANYFVCQRP